MTVILRGKSPRFFAFLLYGLAVLSAIASAIHGGLSELLWAAPFAALIAAFGWVVFHYPRLEIRPGGLRVVNIVREHLIAWSDLAVVENRWGLYLYTGTDRKISVWAVPSTAGLFSNSWRDQKKGKLPEVPDIQWKDAGTETYFVSSSIAANIISRRHQEILSDSQLRASLTKTEHWPEKSVVKLNVLPVLVVVLLLVKVVFTLRGN